MLGWFEGANPWVLLALAFLLNVAIVVVSVCLWRLAVGRWGIRPLNRRDIVLTASTAAANAAVLLPGWWLWREGHLELADATWFRWFLESIYLLAVIDLSMYVAHRLCHCAALYRWFHAWHHADSVPTSLSLFVMHPLEAASFGIVVILAMLIWPVSLLAVSIFFTANLVIGTYAHLPVGAIGPRAGKLRPLSWVQGFHQSHHEYPLRNFGFFTPWWDRIWGTHLGHRDVPNP